MAFAEERIPGCVRYGYSGGAMFSTRIETVNSGAEVRNGIWINGRGEWNIEYVEGREGMIALRDFFRARGGMAQGFRFKDWADYQDEGAGVLLSPVLALGPDGGKFAQLGKRYASVTAAELYAVRKPVAGTLQLKKSGVVQGGWTADYTAGVITFSPLTTLAIASVTKGAVTTIQTSTAHGYSTGKTVSFSGFTSQMAALLNDKPWLITVTGANTFTVPANSTGLTGTFGSVVTYPVVSENWTWTGEFDKPARFNTDKLEVVVEGPDVFTLPSLPVIEIKDFK